MNAQHDTIVAVATGAGAAGIGVVRLSGPRALTILRRLTRVEPAPRVAVPVRFRDSRGRTLDRGLALYFAAPKSFTGEDIVELHAHGSRVVLNQLVDRCLMLGARAARPGEFSERAYLNGKLDLTQAEAIADLIASGSAAQARAAVRSLEGEFARRVHALLSELVQLRVYVEAAIDFPEEEIDFLADARMVRQIDALRAHSERLLRDAQRGQRLRDGLHAVIVGRPNAGKSSLLNALAGSDRAIVTALPGTTRDLLRETIVIDGVELTLVDTAGLRETEDVVEAEGVRRARAEFDRADLSIVLLEPGTIADDASFAIARREGQARIWVHTKIDITDEMPRREVGRDDGDTQLWLSAHTGAGLELLRDELSTRAGGSSAETGGSFSARARHVAALHRVDAALASGATCLRDQRAGELLAEELRLAQNALAEITGDYSSDDLLGAIFSSFCIGK